MTDVGGHGETNHETARPRRWWTRRPGHSLTLRLVLLASGWMILALAITGWALTTQFRDSAYNRLGDLLTEIVDDAVVATSFSNGEVVVAEIMDARTQRLLSGKYWAVAEAAPDGGLRVLDSSESLAGNRLEAPDDLAAILASSPGDMRTYNGVGPRGEPLRIGASMKTLPGGDRPLIFMAGLDRTAVERDTQQFTTLTITALLILGLGLVVAVLLQVQIGLRPLFGLRNEISDVRKGQKARIAGAYPTEIQPLADQVNRLLDQNQETVERQRTHVGNLAHALKTPLAVMLAEANGQEGDLPELVRRQTEVMKGQVDHHLRRARAAARAQMLGETTPIGDVLDELAVMLERVFESKNVEIDWRAPDDLAFRGERQDLQEILGNLLENACKYGRRRVRVSAGPTGLGQMVVVVEDDGPGVAEDQRQAMLQRGARLDETEPGSGLGLAIVGDLTKAYGGKLTLAASDMGGLKVLLELPAAET